MTILGRSLGDDLKKVRLLSSKIEDRLHGNGNPTERLSEEQLGDLNEILKMADYMLTKHEDKKDFHDLLKEFVAMINRSAQAVEEIDGDIEELVLSAEASLSRIRDARARVTEKADLDGSGLAPADGRGQV